MELKNLIQNYLQNSETSFTTYLPDIIKQAEDRILENVQLPVFRKNQVGSLSSSNQYLGIPTDFLAPFFKASLTNLWPSVLFPLIAKNKLFFLRFLEFIDTPL